MHVHQISFKFIIAAYQISWNQLCMRTSIDKVVVLFGFDVECYTLAMPVLTIIVRYGLSVVNDAW